MSAFVENIRLKLAADTAVEITLTSNKPVTQVEIDLLIQMLALQKTAYPKATADPEERHS